MKIKKKIEEIAKRFADTDDDIVIINGDAIKEAMKIYNVPQKYFLELFQKIEEMLEEKGFRYKGDKGFWEIWEKEVCNDVENREKNSKKNT